MIRVNNAVFILGKQLVDCWGQKKKLDKSIRQIIINVRNCGSVHDED